MVQGTTQQATATPTTAAVYIDGVRANLRAYNIGGNNFFMLRDLGEALGFDVGWDEEARAVLISSGTPEPEPEQIQTQPYRPIPPRLQELLDESVEVIRFDYNGLVAFIFSGINLLSSQADIERWAHLVIPDRGFANPETLFQVSYSTGADGNAFNGALFELTHPLFERLERESVPIDIWRAGRQSSITLPNRRLTQAEREAWIVDYWDNGGHNTFELDVVRLVNEVRVEHGLHEVQIDIPLMLAARFYAQTMNNLGTRLGHNEEPYATNPGAAHGASANIAYAFGENLHWGGGNGGSGIGTPEDLVNSWMSSEGHRRYLLSPEHRYIGIGAYSLFRYLFLSATASNRP